jgi:hypothetical protein
MTDTPRVSIRLSRDEAWDFVTASHTGIFTTLRRDGVPIAMPVWFVALDSRIYMQTRGKKLLRIANDPRSSFLVESGDRWVELEAVHLTGVARVLTPGSALVDHVVEAMDRKYSAYRTDRTAMPDETRVAYTESAGGIVEFMPDDRILSWDNSRLGLA